MNHGRGWIVEQVPCTVCEGTHDLFTEVEPVAPYAIDYTCPKSQSAVRLQLSIPAAPSEFQPADAIVASVETREGR